MVQFILYDPVTVPNFCICCPDTATLMPVPDWPTNSDPSIVTGYTCKSFVITNCQVWKYQSVPVGTGSRPISRDGQALS